MKVLIIGSGGREHAIGIAVSKSPLCDEIIFAPGNSGMSKIGKCYDVSATDINALCKIAQDEQVGLTIVGPEQPLVAGIVDLFEKENLIVFGPTAAAARIEGSKAFSKDIMKKYNVPTAAYEKFTELSKAKDYIVAHPGPIVVKASGLAAGKGAIVCENSQVALDALEDMLGEKAVFGESGKEVIIEEMMSGEEASIFAICDGKDYVLLSSAQDHKRVFDNDEGLNTGGMGAYSPAPIVTDEVLQLVKNQVIQPTLDGMKAENCEYRGVLYVGIMMTPEGPKVVEYNARLGDPEAQIVLPLYAGDALELFYKAAQGKINEIEVSVNKGSAAIVVLASKGYPGDYPKGLKITGIEEAEELGLSIIHAGTTYEGDDLLTTGGRVLGVVGTGDTLQAALDKTYAGVEVIKFEGMHFRTDIGKKGLA